MRTIGGQAYTTGYRYDQYGRLASLTYPSGRTVDYVRDEMGRIKEIRTSKDGTPALLVSQVTYQPFGPLQSLVFGNGQAYSRNYDLNGRMTSYTLNGQVQTLAYNGSRCQVCHLDSYRSHLTNLKAKNWLVSRIDIYQREWSRVRMTDQAPTHKHIYWRGRPRTCRSCR